MERALPVGTGTGQAFGRHRPSVWRQVALVAALVAALVLSGAAPAVAETPDPAVFTDWNPAKVSPGDWQEKTATPPDTLQINQDITCAASARSWEHLAKGRSLRLRWYRCDQSQMRTWTAYLDDLRADSPVQWRTAAPALEKDHELVTSDDAEGRSHSRMWIQQRYLVVVWVECARDARADCLALSRDAVRNVSGALPGAPQKITGSRQHAITTWVCTLVVILFGAIGVTAVARRATRETYVVPAAASGRWFNVDADATKQRRRTRRRRFGLLLMAPLAVLLVVYVTGALMSGISIDDLFQLIVYVLMSIPAVILLVMSRSPFPEQRWQWHDTKVLSRRERLGSAALSAVTAGALALALVLFVFATGLEKFAVLSEVVSLLAKALLLVVGPATWLLARALRRRQTRDAWRILNARLGQPIVYLRNFGGADSKVLAGRPLRRGPVSAFFALLSAQRSTGFDDLLLMLLAQHGRVHAVDPPWAMLPQIEVATTRLPPAAYLQAWAAQVAAARAVVVCATPGALIAGDVELLRVLASQAGTKPLMVVFPAYPPQELHGRFGRWRAATVGLAPFSGVDQMPLVNGTMVLLHLPGRGWFGWGATRRDEWTYRRAIYDAVAYASAQVEVAQQAGGGQRDETGAGPITAGDVRPRVMVLAAAADHPLADEVASGLTGMGLATRLDTDTPPTDTPAAGSLPADLDRAVVAVLSEAALRDPVWRAAVDRLHAAGQHLVPLRCGPVQDDAVPTCLRDLNWVEWTANGRVRGLADLFAAVNADPGRYQQHRDLLRQARAWAAGQRRETLLISDFRRAQQAALHVRQAGTDGLARPNQLQYEFAQASLAVARRRRSRLRAFWIAGSVVVAATALVVTSTAFAVRLQGANNRLTGLLASVPMMAADRPDWAALIAGAAMLQGSAQERDIGRRALRELLNFNWPQTFLGVAHDAIITDMAPVSGGRVLTSDGQGSVTAWNRADASVLWRRRVTDGVTDVFAAAADGSVLAVGAGSQVHLVTTEPWHLEAVDVGADVDQLAIAPAARTVAVATGDGRVAAIDLATRQVREVGTYDTVLAVRRTADGTGLRALVASAQGVSVVDVLTGRVQGPLPVRLPEVGATGAIGPDGETVAVGRDDQQLMVGTVRDGLHPTGQSIGDSLSALLVLTADRVVSTSRQDGVKVIDLRVGIGTARLVTDAGVDQLRSSDDGGTLLLSRGLGVAVWHTDDLASMPVAPVGTTLAGTPRAERGALTVEGDANGGVTLAAPDHKTLRLQALDSPVTVVAVDTTGRNVLAGAASGEMVEIDLAHSVVSRRWTAPNAAAITGVGWADTPGRLWVRTADGAWWIAAACDGCGDDLALIDVLRKRLRGCYREQNLANITAEVRTQLGARVCQTSPKAQVA